MYDAGGTPSGAIPYKDSLPWGAAADRNLSPTTSDGRARPILVLGKTTPYTISW
jgi:hypothetical protein